MRKPIKKLYRLTPSNNEIKRVEMEIYKHNKYGCKLFKDAIPYLKGLKRAKELVKVVNQLRC